MKNDNDYNGGYASDFDLIWGQFEPMYETEANPTKMYFILNI